MSTTVSRKSAETADRDEWQQDDDETFITKLCEQVGCVDGAGYDPLLVRTLQIAGRAQLLLKKVRELTEIGEHVGDLVTHRDAWCRYMEMARGLARSQDSEVGDSGAESHLDHELSVLRRAVAAAQRLHDLVRGIDESVEVERLTRENDHLRAEVKRLREELVEAKQPRYPRDAIDAG